MNDSMKTVWVTRKGGLKKQQSMMVLDAFRCHTTNNVKSKLKQHNTDLVVIPSAVSSSSSVDENTSTLRGYYFSSNWS